MIICWNIIDFRPPPWESMHWTPQMLAEFVSKYLGPALNEAFEDNIDIWIHDDQKSYLPRLIKEYFEYDNGIGIKYVNGIGMHWYEFPAPTPGCVLDLCSGSFNHINNTYNYLNDNSYSCYLIGTEACTGFARAFSPPVRGVSLGNWNRGMQYGEDIIGDLISGAVGWVDWNMVLNINGGPNHANNSCDSPVKCV